ncbi:MAG: selenide,water dikinase, partial [Cognaticolwellia sp.]
MTTSSQTKSLPHLVLIGAGHAHIQVLRMHLMRPFPARVTLVVDQCEAVYSGMVPGVLSGQYRPDQVVLDAWPLARKAGVRILVTRAERIDAQLKRVHIRARPALPYDLCSVDIGSTVRGLELPGVEEFALPSRPIGGFVERFERSLKELGTRDSDGEAELVVVGAGAAGIEVAFCAHARLQRMELNPKITLINAGKSLLPGKGNKVGPRIEELATERGITVLHGEKVAALTAGSVFLESGAEITAARCLWVTGAKARPVVQDSGLAHERGYMRVGETLQAIEHPELFAAGDCAHLDHAPWVPKAGVYAVRAGPILAYNLRAKLEGIPLRRFEPQKDFLTLLNLGDGCAIGTKWGRLLEGEWVFRLKNRIDQAFMDKFRVLGPQGAPNKAFERDMPPMPEEEMVCGGCAAKVGADPLSQVLSELSPVQDPAVVLGLDAADDAAALQRESEVMVQSVDVFTAFVDDPFVVGWVASANSLSDLHACGVAPRVALALVNLPRDSDHVDSLRQVMAGVRGHLAAENCTLMGGHTTVGDVLSVGLSVTGFAPAKEALWRNWDLGAGDALILSRPLGTGALFHADMAGGVGGEQIQHALGWMMRGNGPAARALLPLDPSAVTDVTGFGLAGHLIEMLRPKDLSAVLRASALPFLPGVRQLMDRGERSTFHDQNREHLLKVIRAELSGSALEILFDPQTGGGLLVACPPYAVQATLAALTQAGDQPAV